MYATGTILIPKQENAFLSDSTLQVEVITGGLGISAVIRNEGDANLTEITWEIVLDGGFVLLGKKTEGTIPLLRPDKSDTIKIPLVLGFGKTSISVAVNASEGVSNTKTSQARLLGLFARLLPGDDNAFTVILDQVASGLKAPTMLTAAGDGTNRLFVADQPGKIYVIENEELLQTPFFCLVLRFIPTMKQTDGSLCITVG